MKKACFLTLLCVGLAASSPAAPRLYQLYLNGTASTTDNTGKIISFPINNGTLIQAAAKAGGISDTSGLGLAYHFQGNDLGDTIDIIRRADGTVVKTVFGLYFGESFGRMSLLSASHRQMKRIEYVYTEQNDHSLGSALLTDYFYFDSNGNTNNIYVLGQMQWLTLGNATYTNVLVNSANFVTLRPWTFK